MNKSIKKHMLFLLVLILNFTVLPNLYASDLKETNPNNNIIEDGTYYIKNLKTYKYMQSSEKKDSQNIEQNEFSGSDNQKWTIKNIGNGYITIQSNLSEKKMISVNNGSKEDNANIELSSQKESDAQKFKLNEIVDSSYAIFTKSSNETKVLDVDNSKHDNKANVMQCSFTKDLKQLWEFEAVSEIENENNSLNQKGTLEASDFNSLVKAIRDLEKAGGGTIYIKSDYIVCKEALRLEKKNANITIAGADGYNPVLDFSNIKKNKHGKIVGLVITGSGYYLNNIEIINYPNYDF